METVEQKSSDMIDGLENQSNDIYKWVKQRNRTNFFKCGKCGKIRNRSEGYYNTSGGTFRADHY